jgi:hypothetical protein
MACYIGLFENGCTGKRDGTLLSTADAETNPFPFAALNTAYSLHYRVIDSSGNDPTQDTTDHVEIAVPTGVSISTDGSTWETGHTEFPAATGGNQRVYVKQTAMQPTGAVNMTVGVGGVTFTAGTRVGQVTNFCSSIASCSSVLQWSAIAGETGFEIEYCAKASDPGSGSWAAETGYTLTTAATDAVTKTITGLTNGTKYWFRCRAFAATGVGAWSTADDATPTSDEATFSDTFADSSLHARWGTSVAGSGSVTEGAGTLAIAGLSAVSDGAILYLKQPVTRETRAYTVLAKSPAAGTGDTMFLTILQTGSSTPAIDTVANVNATLRIVALQNAGAGFWIYYKTTGGTWTNWNGQSNAWATDGVTAFYPTVAANDTYYTVILETTATRFRIIVKDAAGTTTIETTDWIDWTTVCSDTANMYLSMGDPYNNSNYKNLTVDTVTKA